MKIKSLSLLITLTISMRVLYASNTKVGNIWYDFNNQNMTASVTFEGAWYEEYSNEYSGSIVIPSSVTYNNKTYNVTEVGSCAFRGCDSLISVIIPKGITRIGDYAFCDCHNITSIKIPNTVTNIGIRAFYDCTSLPIINNIRYADTYLLEVVDKTLSTYTIQEGTKWIGHYAFQDCNNLRFIIIPNSIIDIGPFAFSNCSLLNNVIIPDSVTFIHDSSFRNCISLTSINIPKSVLSIELSTFSGCTNITSVYINSRSIAHRSLVRYYGSQVTEYILGDNVTSIGSSTFAECSSLKSVTLGNGITSIWNRDFSNCNQLNSIYVPCGKEVYFKQLLSNYSDIIQYLPLPYIITISNLENGIVTYPKNICDESILEAIPSQGYHFVQWSDSSIVNPRIIELNQDTTFGAEFRKDIIISYHCDSTKGLIKGDTVSATREQGYVTFEAVPKYGFHFMQWNDSITDNPRTIYLTQDTAFTAEFAKNPTITYICDQTMGAINGATTLPAEAAGSVTFEAVSNYGYHFVHWSDSMTDNPRTIYLTTDTVFVAEFAKNKYTITTAIDDSIHGQVFGDTTAFYLDTVSLAAIANYGYHFVQWSDGNTDNPRTITVEGDSSIIAVFANNTYNVTYHYNQTQGVVTGAIDSEYLQEVSFEATPNYGYHFVQWSDGIDENPRTFVLTQDTVFTAEFAKNPVITYVCDPTMGTINGATTLRSEAAGNVTFEAAPNYGYHFVQWGDGNIDNPRTIYLSKDTTFTAEFAVDKSGSCGDDFALTWSYNDKSKVLTINGDGALTANYTFGVEAPSKMQTLIIGSGVTNIGNNAFYGVSSLNHLSIGSAITTIGDYAFAECRNFDDITCYAVTVPVITSTTFDNIGNKKYIYLYVPENRERAYLRDDYWGEFDVQVQKAETVTEPVEDVSVVPSDNTADITWPAVNGAETYEIQITKDGEVICTLSFNMNGQLTGIAFAPSRDGNNHAQQAQVAGFKFTVTGLTSETRYGYSITSKDGEETIIDTKSGFFTTTNGETPEGFEDISSEDTAPRKVMIDGHVYILRGDKIYTLQGKEVK